MDLMTARQPPFSFDAGALAARIDRHWDDDIVARLVEYVRVPAKSPHFDHGWREHGHLETVIQSALAWVQRQGVAGLKAEIVRLEGRTPVLFFDVPARGSGASQRTVVLYGHLDK